jgi:hypothetical protein
MKLLFLDDSYQRTSNYLGYGGFYIDSVSARQMNDDISRLKEDFKIPPNVEIKWSPPKDHFLQTGFKGVRHKVYREAIRILEKHGAKVMCAVHALNDCYPTLNNWGAEKTRVWCAKAQLTYISERFQSLYLECCNDDGLIITDEYGAREGEESIISNFKADMIIGTEYHKLERICMIPLMLNSRHLAHLQLADVVIGIIVSALSGGKYGLELFDDVAKIFLTDPCKGSTAFVSVFSAAVLGYGLKLFPPKFQRAERKLFESLDDKYIVTNKGLVERGKQEPLL